MEPASKKRKCDRPPLKCGWTDCCYECASDWDLNGHISEHLEQYMNKECSSESSSSDDYECQWKECTFNTRHKDDYQRHVYYHGYYTDLLVQGKYECDNHPEIPTCHALQREGHIVPELKSNFQCRWADCNRSFLSIVEFQDHIVQHASFEYEIQKSPDDERPKTECKWDFCHKLLENKYRLIEHTRTHSSKKFVACYHCGELFRTKTTLFDHLRRQPDNNTHKYQCAQCFKYFATEKLLRVHVIKHVNCYKCTMCDMTCSSASALAMHVRYRHLKDKPFKCSQCDTRCVRQSDLEKHTQIVHSKNGQRCDQPGCQYTVRTYTQLKRHMLEVHNNSPIVYVCHCCDKFLKSGKTLSAHLIKKHNFQLPSGHKRFMYRQDENGFYRLETMRIESLEVTQQILTKNETPTEEFSNGAVNFEPDNAPKSDIDLERIVFVNDAEQDTQKVSQVVISLPDLS